MSNDDPLSVLLERLSRILQNEAHAGGLKPTQWEALRYLARANRFSRNPSALTMYLGMTKGTVSQTLKALERKNLVRKQTDPADRRNLRLDLTQDGANVLKRDPIAALFDIPPSLSPKERRQVADGLTTIIQAALRRRGGRPFGVCESCRFFQANAAEGTPHRCGLLKVPLTADDSQRICVEQEEAA